MVSTNIAQPQRIPELFQDPSMALSPVFLVGIRSGVEAIRTSPAQALDSTPARMIFAANPAGIAQFIDEAEEIRVVDLTHIWFMAPGIPAI